MMIHDDDDHHRCFQPKVLRWEEIWRQTKMAKNTQLKCLSKQTRRYLCRANTRKGDAVWIIFSEITSWLNALLVSSYCYIAQEVISLCNNTWSKEKCQNFTMTCTKDPCKNKHISVGKERSDIQQNP